MTLDQLIDQIRTEVLRLTNSATPDSDEFRQQTSVSLIARIPVILSSAIYSFHLASGTAPRGIGNTLALGAGLCGDHVLTGEAVLEALGVPHRDIQVLYTDGETPLNHTFLEIPWAGSWRMVDVTWGFIPHAGSLESALSYQDAVASNHREGLHHSSIPWRRAVEDKYDIFGYLTGDPDAVFVRGSGDVRVALTEGAIELIHPTSNLIGSFPHRPGVSGEHKLSVAVPEGAWRLDMTISTARSGEINVAGRSLRVTEGHHRGVVKVKGPCQTEIRFSPDSADGHLELEELRGGRLRAPTEVHWKLLARAGQATISLVGRSDSSDTRVADLAV